MANANRLPNSGLRHPSLGAPQASSGQSPMLLARINEKKAELEDLKQLRDLSANLAAQVQTLQEKLSTLSDGTEVLQAINMASMKIPKPKIAEGGDATEIVSETALPQTLVRIPVEQEPSQPEPIENRGKEP
ncbi:MAG: hypothetical protein Q9201_004549 [Fulgogasparrea decipioides]